MTTHQPPQDLVNLIDELVGQALVRHYDPKADESLTECRVCGGWEEHTADCPIPACEKWLHGPEHPTTDTPDPQPLAEDYPGQRIVGHEDFCDDCGHTLSAHHRYVNGAYRCKVLGGGCERATVEREV